MFGILMLIPSFLLVLSALAFLVFAMTGIPFFIVAAFTLLAFGVLAMMFVVSVTSFSADVDSCNLDSRSNDDSN